MTSELDSPDANPIPNEEASKTPRSSNGAADVGGLAISLRSQPLGGLGRARLWDFMWDSHQIPRWLGLAPAGPLDGSLVTVTSRTSEPRHGTLAVAGGEGETCVLLTLRPLRGGSGTEATNCVIRVKDSGNQKVRVVIDETGFASRSEADVARERWRDALEQIARDAAKARQRAEQPRQAVVVFHGMGNQRPGDTLISLVTGGAIPGEESGWVKPDRMSESFELRSYALASDPGLGRPPTDFYEAYWAHLVQGTTTSQVTAWAGSVLGTWRHVPKPLALSLWLIRVLVLIALWVVLAVSVGWITPPPLLTSGFVVAVAALVWGLISKTYAGVLGDVARYLRPLPENIETRQRIREVGVDLLSKLHDDGRYDRIVVLGHSLGSVVAYDVLTQLWIERHRQHDAPNRATFTPLRAVERAVTAAPTHRGGPPEPVSLDEARLRQHQAWAGLRANTQPWLITDFVTVGSPLAHARTLLTKNPTAFDDAVRSRIYPTCPPVVETERRSGLQRITYDRPYPSSEGGVRTFTMLHHAAPFAVTRWTNLHFRPRLLGIKGDPVGGEVSAVFGPWVKDVTLEAGQWVWKSHTGYWSSGTTAGNVHLGYLQDALDLETAVTLRTVCQQLPLRLPHARR